MESKPECQWHGDDWRIFFYPQPEKEGWVFAVELPPGDREIQAARLQKLSRGIADAVDNDLHQLKNSSGENRDYEVQCGFFRSDDACRDAPEKLPCKIENATGEQFYIRSAVTEDMANKYAIDHHHELFKDRIRAVLGEFEENADRLGFDDALKELEAEKMPERDSRKILDRENLRRIVGAALIDCRLDEYRLGGFFNDGNGEINLYRTDVDIDPTGLKKATEYIVDNVMKRYESSKGYFTRHNLLEAVLDSLYAKDGVPLVLDWFGVYKEDARALAVGIGNAIDKKLQENSIMIASNTTHRCR